METYIKTQILNGKLELPSESLFTESFGGPTTKTIKQMFSAMWYNYLHDGEGLISLTYWAEKFSNPEVFNKVLVTLSTNGWMVCNTIPARNWSEAKLNVAKLYEYGITDSELEHVRASHKFDKYLPVLKQSKVTNLTKINGRVRDTGLVRYGLAASAGSTFTYDSKYLNKYKEAIIRNVNKGMEKVRHLWPEMQSDQASYDAIASEIVEYLCITNETYSMGNNYSDSRGRAIKEALSKVANPIGYKDFRALLVIPEQSRAPLDKEAEFAVFLFIAELLGKGKDRSIGLKARAGKRAYERRELPELNLDSEKDRKDLYELIWLERLYDELALVKADSNHLFSVPVELDASASVLSHQGALLGDKRLLEMTNTSYTGTMNDPWKFTGIGRRQFKDAATPLLFGSSKSCTDQWEANKEHYSYTPEQVIMFNKELNSGALGIANELKEFIIRYVKPSPEMSVKVYEDQFTIECNRFKQVGEVTIRYDIYDTESGRVRRIAHTKTRAIPDLDQFRRYFVTLLVHSQDSQVLDFVMENVMSTYGWAIDIHDAMIISPHAAMACRLWYAEEIQIIYDNRKDILAKYFHSIGIGPEAQADYDSLMAKVVPVENFKASPWALK